MVNPLKTKRLIATLCLSFISLVAQDVLAVMPPAYYKRLQEQSGIKAVAIVESIEVLETTKQKTHKKAVFKLEKSLEGRAPKKFSGIFYSVDFPWQEPGVGGTIYYYPHKGQRVFVTVSSNGGTITGLTYIDSIKSQNESVLITDRKYRYSIKGKPVGTFHVMGLYRPENNIPYLFHHEFKIEFEGESIFLNMETQCDADEFYSPRKIVNRGHGQEVWPFSAFFEGDSQGGTFKIKSKEKDLSLEAPGRLVSEYVIFELVRNLPFDKDKVFEFNKLESPEMRIKKNHKIRYMGRDENEMTGKNGLHRFKEIGGGGGTYFWVNDKRQLVRVVWDKNKEFNLIENQ
jgi:hypothetical protein